MVHTLSEMSVWKEFLSLFLCVPLCPEASVRSHIIRQMPLSIVTLSVSCSIWHGHSWRIAGYPENLRTEASHWESDKGLRRGRERCLMTTPQWLLTTGFNMTQSPVSIVLFDSSHSFLKTVCCCFNSPFNIESSSYNSRGKLNSTDQHQILWNTIRHSIILAHSLVDVRRTS